MFKFISVLAWVLIVGNILMIQRTKDVPTPYTFITEHGPSVVKVLRPDLRGGGTGFAVRSEATGTNFIITNSHVCALAFNGNMTLQSPLITALIPDKKEEVRVIQVVEDDDLCILTSPPYLKPLVINTQYTPYQTLTSVGFPLLGSLTASQGMLLGFARVELIWGTPIKKCKGDRLRVIKQRALFWDNFLCLREFNAMLSDVKSYPGSSGSPVFDQRGEVVGVVFAGRRQTHHADMISAVNVKKLLRGY